MSILKRIGRPIEERRKLVQWQGDTYAVVGSSDIALFEHTLFLDDDAKARRAAHWEAVTGRSFHLETVPKLLLICATLEHEEDPARRYDEIEIAQLALRDGALASMLFAAAAEVTGWGANAADVLEETALKN
jgi:hypothetical protein